MNSCPMCKSKKKTYSNIWDGYKVNIESNTTKFTKNCFISFASKIWTITLIWYIICAFIFIIYIFSLCFSSAQKVHMCVHIMHTMLIHFNSFRFCNVNKRELWPIAVDNMCVCIWLNDKMLDLEILMKTKYTSSKQHPKKTYCFYVWKN